MKPLYAPNDVGTVVYESENFLVVAYGRRDNIPTWAFDLVRKNVNSDVTKPLLHHFPPGDPRTLHIAHQKLEWDTKVPQQTEVEDFIDRWTQLGGVPMEFH